MTTAIVVVCLLWCYAMGFITGRLSRDIEENAERLRELLAQANDAFDECTGDYPKELVEGEPWRKGGSS